MLRLGLCFSEWKPTSGLALNMFNSSTLFEEEYIVMVEDVNHLESLHPAVTTLSIFGVCLSGLFSVTPHYYLTMF